MCLYSVSHNPGLFYTKMDVVFRLTEKNRLMKFSGLLSREKKKVRKEGRKNIKAGRKTAG